MTIVRNDRSNAGDDRTTAKSCPYCTEPLAGAGPNGGDCSLAVNVHVRDHRSETQP